MCLDTVIKRYEKNDNMVEVYKTLIVGERGGLYDHYKLSSRRVGKEYMANNIKLAADDGTLYDSGFHAIISKKKALECKCMNLFWPQSIAVYRVHIWDIRALGIDDGEKVIVGKHMRIIERVE